MLIISMVWEQELHLPSSMIPLCLTSGTHTMATLKTFFTLNIQNTGKYFSHIESVIIFCNRVVRYPKAGEVNPSMTLFVRNIIEDDNKKVVPPESVVNWGEYIYTVADWTRADVLSVTWMNRIQNKSVISECREAGDVWECKAIYTQEQPSGWIEIAPPPTYSGDTFIQILPSTQDSDNRNYKHIARLDPGQTEPVFLTRGNYVVTEILSWDTMAGLVYYMGTDTRRPGSRHLYVVPDTGDMDSQCITCDIKVDYYCGGIY